VVSTVAGVDACRGGWVVATLSDDRPDAPPVLSLSVTDALRPLVADLEAGHIAAVAVDMPVGLSEAGPRACDVAARARLGARRSSVFPAPSRPVLDARDHADAIVRERAASGRGLSLQAFNLVPKIAEVDGVVTPDLQDRLVEAHPELGFTRLAGAPATHPKRTAVGRSERRSLLAAVGLAPPPDLRLPGAAADDILDAVVLTLTATRVRDGTAERLGDGAHDARGLRMEIVV
jgi:predicted RNase H-like nuclease